MAELTAVAPWETFLPSSSIVREENRFATAFSFPRRTLSSFSENDPSSLSFPFPLAGAPEHPHMELQPTPKGAAPVPGGPRATPLWWPGQPAWLLVPGHSFPAGEGGPAVSLEPGHNLPVKWPAHQAPNFQFHLHLHYHFRPCPTSAVWPRNWGREVASSSGIQRSQGEESSPFPLLASCIQDSAWKAHHKEK